MQQSHPLEQGFPGAEPARGAVSPKDTLMSRENT